MCPCIWWWGLVFQFLDGSYSTFPTKFQMVLLLLVSKPSSSDWNNALRNCRATVWYKAQLPVFPREESIVSWRTVTVACIPLQCLSLATHLLAFQMVMLFLCVQCFAANENDTAILWNLSTLSVGNDLDLFPADSDIPEEITFSTSQGFARHWWGSLCCKPLFPPPSP